MSKTNQEIYLLGSIVDDWVLENQLSSGFWSLGLVFAKKAVRKLSLDIHQTVKTVLLPVTDRKTVTLPEGFVDWTKVGLQYGQYCITIGTNEELNGLNRTAGMAHVAGLASQHIPNGLDFGQYGGFTFFNYGGASVWGFGGGVPSKGYFKVHDNGSCKELLMDYDFGISKVYLEYITDGLDVCEGTVIHAYHYDYIFKYMDFRRELKLSPKATRNTIEWYEKDMLWEEKLVRVRHNQLDPKTLINLSRQETRLTPHI